MLSANQHATGDEEKPYCIFCATPDGSLRSYDEVLERLTEYYLQTEPVDRFAASEMAREHLATLPAWSRVAAM